MTGKETACVHLSHMGVM